MKKNFLFKSSVVLVVSSLLWLNNSYAQGWKLTGNFLTPDTGLLGTTNNKAVNIITNGASRLFINRTGAIGINTTNPSTKFHVNGAQTMDGSFIFSNGNYGIQFGNPSAGFVPMMSMFKSGTSNPPRMVIAHSPAFNNWGLSYDDASDTWDFLAGGTSIFKIPPSGYIQAPNGLVTTGRIGVGTSTPSYLLDVAGRMRLRTGTLNDITSTAGTWYDDFRDGTERIFTGMQDSLRWGVYGSGSGGKGWMMNINAKSGNANIGNTTNDFYRLNVTGSDNGIGLYNASGGFYGNVLSDAGGNLVMQASYGNTFSGSSAKNILLNNPASSVFFRPGNVGINTNTPNARLHVGGTVYIGTTSGAPATGYQLSVDGKIIATEVRVEATASWPDYVFANDYKLTPLDELEAKLNADKHLPGIPSATEIKEGGIMLGEMQTKTIEKVEENTLYILQLNNKIKELEKKIETLTRLIK